MKIIFTILTSIHLFFAAYSQSSKPTNYTKADSIPFGWSINRDANQAQFQLRPNGSNSLPNLYIDGNTGNVGVGTSIPSNKLEVNGSIRCREVSVEAGPWPDFVFGESYPLKSIYEVERYIIDNHHLPDLPSAAEVEKNGIKLSDINAKLLQKVEELTLYLIAQQKRIDELENRLKTK